jgi:uncharacterized tellurite resistance protein B-like protein
LAETTGTVIGIIVVMLIILAPFALIAWLVIWLVRRSNRKSAEAQTSKSSAAVNQAPAIAPAGFYADPERPDSQRWWDGQHWAPLEVVPEKSAKSEPQHAGIVLPNRPPASPRETVDYVSVGSTDSSSDQRTPRHAADVIAAESNPAAATATPAVLAKNGDRIRYVEWFASREPVTVAGYTIPGGLIYVGRKLAAPQRSIEPSLINPSLRVDVRAPDTMGVGLSYWPTYEGLSPESRAAYLQWLAEGRRNPDTPLGYVFLFMYGLERRVLVDMQATGSSHPDLLPIRAEMTALVEIYAKRSNSFQGYARGFLDVIDMMVSSGSPAGATGLGPPALSTTRWMVPISPRIALGEFAADRLPVPADWALAWAWFNPTYRIRTVATRCTDEFSVLFKDAYTKKYGAGLTVQPGATTIGLTYYAASSGIGYAKLEMKSIPDVFSFVQPTRALDAISDEAQESLAAFSRYLGKDPDGRDKLSGIALLPGSLVAASTNVKLDAFRSWLADVVAPNATSVVPSRELLKQWLGGTTTSLTKTESVPLIQLLSKLGIGVEPDVRFGGAPLSVDTPVVLFPLADDSPLTPSASYETAATLTHFAAAVSAADGHVSDDEVQAFLPSIESTLDLSGPEKTRLAAHFQWLTASPTKLTGLTKRVALLTDTQRVNLGGLLVSVAAADGNITASEMTSLTKIFGLLGLDQSDIASRAFAAQASPTSAAREPITVRVASVGALGIPVPPRPQSTAAPGTIVLDNETIERTMKESASVSELLRGIFDDDQPEPTAAAAPTASVPPEVPAASAALPSESTEPGIAGLDTAHSTIVRLLAGRDSVSHLEFEELARAQKVMPNGAIDTINEAAFDASEEPLLEGDDILTINPHALQEMLK